MEVLSACRGLTALAQVPVQDLDLTLIPAKDCSALRRERIAVVYFHGWTRLGEV